MFPFLNTIAKSTISQRFFVRFINSEFLRKIAVLFVTRILVSGIGVLAGALITRFLGPEGRGILAVATTVTGVVAQFGNFGLHSFSVYRVAKDKLVLPALLMNGILISVVWGSAALLVLYIAQRIGALDLPFPPFTLLLSLVAASVSLIYLFSGSLLVGVMDIHAYSTIELATRILSIALSFLLVIMGMATVDILLMAGLGTAILTCLLFTFRLNSHVSLKGAKLNFDLFRDGFSYGLKAYVAALFAFLVIRVDLLMVEHLLGITEAGYYSVAVSMADWVYMLPVAIGTVLFPKLSAFDSDSLRWQMTRRTAIAVSIMISIGAGLVAFLSPWIVELLYGSEFAQVAPAVSWLMPAIIFLSINTVFMNYFASIGMPWIAVYSPGVALLVNVVLNLLLLPQMGIVGASLASAVSYGLMLIFSLIYIAHRSHSGFKVTDL